MDFFLIGQPKAGTTAIHEMLSQHPRIFMSRPKEPQFFAADMKRRFDPEGWPVLPQSLDEYLALFADASPDQLRGDASTLYMPSRVAAAQIAEFNPDARVVAVVREPASLLRSLHLQTLGDRNEDERDLRRALELEPERRAGRMIPETCYRPQELLYSDHPRYVEQLRRFAGLETLVLAYDDLRADNNAAVNRILRFLGLEEIEVEPVRANRSVVVRSHRAGRVLHRISTGPARWLGRVAPRQLRRRALAAAYAQVQKQPPPLDPELAAELKRRYAPEVAALSDYLGRDFAGLWGY
jgi:hypothetical protein